MTAILLSLTAAAQRYPVTVTPTLLPPYTLNLSELTAPASARLMATITVNDLTASNLPVRLHFKLESTGITIESIKTAAVAPLFLGGGETLVLTGSDMAQYLRLDNLDFRGYSKEQYRQTGQLPGGMWRLTIEAHHFHNHRVLSNRGTATVWVSIYDPPALTAPSNGTEAPDNPSLPLIFNWQPSKHTGGTEAVQYRLQVWEMRMQGVPAQTVAASMTPIFETTTAATTHTAIPAAMNLEPGMQYCWRVTVFDPSGKALINKNGQSEVREFTYLHTCPTVDEVTATVHNARVDFSWTPSPYHTHFQVELVGDNGVSELNDCYDSQFKLYDFPLGSTWKVRVRGECSGGLEADWSPWSDFEIDPPGTPPTPEECPNCGCDDAPKPRAITNYELKELHEGDTIENRTGRTRFIVLTAVPNGDGSYNGQFYLWLELWKTKVRCDYTDLKVNTDGVIFDGQWRSVRNDGLMVNPAAVAEAIESIKNNVAAATYDNYIRDTVKFTYPIQTIYKDQNDNYIAVLADGTELDVTQRLSNAGHTLIEDSEGNQMAVTGDHRLMSAEQYHKTGKNNTLIKSDNERKDKQIAASGEVIFKPSGNQQYGFDAYDASTNNHPEIYPMLEGGSYRPAYKSVAQWQQDKVTADPIDGVTFRTQMGVPYAKANGEILLRGEPLAGETPVYAHVAETDSTTKVVGKLNLLTFEPKEINVCLVPVNGASLPNTQTLEAELNKIFKPAVASVKVSTHSGITIEYANGSGFVHGGSGPLTVYSDDEKAAINALTDANDDTYYLFLVKNVTKLDADGNNTIVSGYMPVGYQHGFIFEQFDVARTIAHELSHGAFALHHTFSANTESFHADEGTTNNLMDYTEHGTTLNHKQWQWMHENHGKGLLGFLADEDEGENISLTGIFYAILNGNENYKLYDKSSITILAGTDVDFEIAADELIANKIISSFEKQGESDIHIDSIKVREVSIKFMDSNSNEIQYSTLSQGKYSCEITVEKYEYYIRRREEVIKYTATLKEAYNFAINISVVDQPIVRIEPSDRENFFLKFGYDDALVEENQSRGDYPKEIIARQNYYVPWLHIQPNIEAEMKLDFNCDELYVSVPVIPIKLIDYDYWVPDSRIAPPTKLVHETEIYRKYALSFIVKGDDYIKINGKDSIELTIDRINDVMKISCNNTHNGFVSVYTKDLITGKLKLAGKLEVECRQMKTIGTIKVYSAKRYDEDKYPTINQDEILDFVNKYYVQAGVRFELDSSAVALFEIKTKSVKEKLNVISDFILANGSINNETQNFTKTKKCNLFLATDNHFIDEDGKHTTGQTNKGQGWSYVLLENKNYIVIVHELGHVLDLPHTFKQDRKDNLSNTIKDQSTINIMDYESTYTNHRKLFYKYQINHIYKTHNAKQ